jgi:hypothetical protein
MSLPVSFPRNLDEFYVPVENDDYLPLTVTLDGVAYTTYEVAIFEPGESRPLTAWVANPGPKTPTTIGRYPVFVRATGSPKPAVCVGYLNVF